MTGTGDPLVLRRSPIRMVLSSAPWRAAGYLAGYPLYGTVLCVCVVVALALVLATGVTWLSVPMALGAGEIIRLGSAAERGRAVLVGERLAAPPRPESGPGVIRAAAAWFTDPPTLSALCYLVLLFAPLLAIDLIALSVLLVSIAGLALPLWYRAIPVGHPTAPSDHGVLLGYFPDATSAPVGLWVGDVWTASAAAVGFSVLLIAACYLLVATARLHRWFARRLLSPPADPLAAAKRVLNEPGPLALSIQSAPNTA